MDWRNWCRLCANPEVTEKIDTEIQKIAEQIFMVFWPISIGIFLIFITFPP
jgi:hypothetical protein